jgi:hypothetical protein
MCWVYASKAMALKTCGIGLEDRFVALVFRATYL